jgi:hypothetical protein
MRRLLMAVVIPVAVVSCASARPPRERVEVIYGSAYQTCAREEKQHHEFGEAKHAHLMARAFVQGKPAPGDTLVVRINGTREVARFHADRGIVSVEWPAGIGAHEVTVEWVTADGRVRDTGHLWLSVWDCVL